MVKRASFGGEWREVVRRASGWTIDLAEAAKRLGMESRPRMFAKRDVSPPPLPSSLSQPEMLRGQTQTYAVDWWGLGVLLHELTTRTSPWGPSDMNDLALLKRISAHISGHLALSDQISQVGENVWEGEE